MSAIKRIFDFVLGKSGSKKAQVLHEQAVGLMQEDKDKEALVLIDESLKAYPKYFNSRFTKGSILIKLRQYEEAVEEFNAALNLDGEHEHPLVGIGNALAGQKRYREALEYYRQAIEINADSFGGWFGSALSHADLRDWNSAKKAIDIATMIVPSWEIALDIKKSIYSKQDRIYNI